MRRRRLLSRLAAAAATGAATGCLGVSSDTGSPGTAVPGRTEDGPGRTPTRAWDEDPTTTERVVESATAPDSGRLRLAPGESFTTGDGRELTVSEPTLRRLVVVLEEVSHHDYHRVAAAPPGQQYLVTTVEYRGFDDRSAVPLSVTLDGERRDERTPVFSPTATELDATPTRVGLLVPVTDVDRGAVVWERPDGPAVRWRLPDGVRSAVGTVPEFDVRSLSVPDAVEHGAPIPVTFTVANTGDRDGRFVVECDARQGSLPLDETTVRVPAGESVRRTVDVVPYYDPSIETVPVVFDWGRNRVERDVSVRSSATATEWEP